IDACVLGGSGDPVSYPFYMPGSNRAIRQVELFLSSNGSASTLKTYQLQLTAKLDGFNGTLLGTSIVNVTLTGRNSQLLQTAFRFASPFGSGNSHTVAYELKILSNPDGATISYNTGPC